MAISEKLINRLNDLLMLEHDALEAYEQAISRMTSTVCKDKLSEFRNDHRRHLSDIRKVIEDFGARPKDHRDLKGVFIKGMTALQSMAGDEMALKAMQTNERLTNKTYQDALDDLSMPEDVHALVARNRADEERHLNWITMALNQRLWESAGPTAQP